MHRGSLVTLCAMTIACNGILGHRSGTLAEAGDDAATDVEAGPPGPSGIFGDRLVLWLDAADESTVTLEPNLSRVLRWNDKSGQGNDARAVYAIGPQAAILHIAFADHPVMKFNGTHDDSGIFQINDKTSLQFGQQDFLVMAVVAYSNVPAENEVGGYANIWVKTNATAPYWGPTLVVNAAGAPLSDGGVGGASSRVFAGIETFAVNPGPMPPGVWSATDGWNDGALHLLVMRKETTAQRITIQVDKTITPSVGPLNFVQTLSAAGRPVTIGGYQSMDGVCCWAPLDGAIAELIAVKGVTTSSEVDALNAYVRDKYGLAL